MRFLYYIFLISFAFVRGQCANHTTRNNETTGSKINYNETMQGLWYINQYRSCWNSSSLHYDMDLQITAQDWAQILLRRITTGDEITHGMLFDNKNRPVGQNIIVAYSAPRYKIEKAVKKWYAEYVHYNGKYDESIGHFSQMVWNSTQRVGIGIARDQLNSVFVANFIPPGNVLNEFQKNIFSLTHHTPFCILKKLKETNE